MKHFAYGTLCCAFFMGCVTPLYKEKVARSPAQSDPLSQITIPQDQNLTFSDFQEIVLSKKSIEGVLATLNQKYSDYMRFHTLMYGSLSLHESSFEEPRVIIFGPKAKFILTFNGNIHQKGGLSFETVEYSDELRSFLFREIAFKSPGFQAEDMNLHQDEVAFQNDNVIISKPNPTKCLQCHGSTASPIWMTYFLWPGAYGSHDDHLYMSFDRSSWNANNIDFFGGSTAPQSQGRLFALREGFADKEVEGYVRYLKRKPHHPRYKWLPPHTADQSFIRYAQGEAFNQLDISKRAAAERAHVKITALEWPSRPNFFFQILLQDLNQDRLIARLERAGLKNVFKSPEWQKLATHLSRIKIKDSVPEVARLTYKALLNFEFKKARPSLKEIEAQIEANLKDEFSMQLERVYRQEQNFGRDSIRLSYPVEDNNPVSNLWIDNYVEFYSRLLKLKHPSEKEKIAIIIEQDDVALITALSLLLQDRGFDLHDYNMNLRQANLSFHSGGLDEVARFLGIDVSF